MPEIYYCRFYTGGHYLGAINVLGINQKIMEAKTNVGTVKKLKKHLYYRTVTTAGLSWKFKIQLMEIPTTLRAHVQRFRLRNIKNGLCDFGSQRHCNVG